MSPHRRGVSGANEMNRFPVQFWRTGTGTGALLQN